jgi:hypothetical protein
LMCHLFKQLRLPVLTYFGIVITRGLRATTFR